MDRQERDPCIPRPQHPSATVLGSALQNDSASPASDSKGPGKGPTNAVTHVRRAGAAGGCRPLSLALCLVHFLGSEGRVWRARHGQWRQGVFS